MNQITSPIHCQSVQSGVASGLPELKLTEFSGDSLEWPECLVLIYVVGHQKQISDTEKINYLKTSLTGQAKATISGMGFSSESNYYAWVVLREKYSRSYVIANAQFLQILTHPQVWHNNSKSIVKFADVVTIVANTLTQLG